MEKPLEEVLLFENLVHTGAYLPSNLTISSCTFFLNMTFICIPYQTQIARSAQRSNKHNLHSNFKALCSQTNTICRKDIARHVIAQCFLKPEQKTVCRYLLWEGRYERFFRDTLRAQSRALSSTNARHASVKWRYVIVRVALQSTNAATRVGQASRAIGFLSCQF